MTRCPNGAHWCGKHGICDQCRRDEQKRRSRAASILELLSTAGTSRLFSRPDDEQKAKVGK